MELNRIEVNDQSMVIGKIRYLVKECVCMYICVSVMIYLATTITTSSHLLSTSFPPLSTVAQPFREKKWKTRVTMTVETDG